MPSLRVLPTVTALLVIGTAACSSGDDGSTGRETQENTAGGGGSAGSGTGNGAFLGSCDTRSVAGPSIGQCRDWNGDSNLDLSVSCAGLDGVFSATMPCPTEGRVGTCELEPALGAVASYRYYEGEYTESEARNECDGLTGAFTGSGSSGTGGAGSGGSGGGGTDCPPECLRAYECVSACGETPVNTGCCPCPEGMIDAITCP